MSLDGTYDHDNVFAKILRGEVPAVRVYEDDEILAFMDIYPQADGHVLVISKTSTARTILDMERATLQTVVGAVQRIAAAIRTALQPDGVVVAQFSGRAAGQTVDHFHFHVIPCWAGKPLRPHGSQLEPGEPERLRELARVIAGALAA
ncbi:MULTISPECIES: HIT family protein [Rhodomicrobium]|uniref:HIT family protein n=1 Tax=Rhodomicrobium TaxID=1068 RepID=UPI000B4AEBC5|nr:MULTISPECIES: HIT family protein [Rhodomicrobium]